MIRSYPRPLFIPYDQICYLLSHFASSRVFQLFTSPHLLPLQTSLIWACWRPLQCRNVAQDLVRRGIANLPSWICSATCLKMGTASAAQIQLLATFLLVPITLTVNVRLFNVTHKASTIWPRSYFQPSAVILLYQTSFVQCMLNSSHSLCWECPSSSPIFWYTLIKPRATPLPLLWNISVFPSSNFVFLTLFSHTSIKALNTCYSWCLCEFIFCTWAIK